MNTYEIAYKYDKDEDIQELEYEAENILGAIGCFLEDNGSLVTIISVTLIGED